LYGFALENLGYTGALKGLNTILIRIKEGIIKLGGILTTIIS
jgi:hypothetical protein